MERDGSNVYKILDTLVFPENKPCLRYNDGASATKTACQNLTQEFSLTWTTAVTDRDLKATDMLVFLFRDPLRAVIYYDHNVSRSPFTYQIKNALDNQNSYALQPGMSGYFLPGDRATANTTYAPHGPVLYPVDCDGHPGYWCDNDGSGNYTRLIFDLDNGTTVAGGQAEFFVWTGSRWALWAIDPMVDGTATYGCPVAPPPGGAYMTVAVSLPRPTTATTIIGYLLETNGPGPSVWCHRSVPQLESLLTTIQASRVIAAAVKWQNESPVLDESGKVTAVVLPPELPWSNIASGASRLSEFQGYKTMPAKKGYYGFTQPSEDQMEWQHSIRMSAIRGQSSVVNTGSPVNSQSPYLAIGMSIANANARDTSISVTHMIEFMTSVKTQEVHRASGSADDWSEALRRLASVPNHYEANVVLSDIFGNKRQRI